MYSSFAHLAHFCQGCRNFGGDSTIGKIDQVSTQGVPQDILFLIRADREKKTKKKMFCNIFGSDSYFGTYRALSFT